MGRSTPDEADTMPRHEWFPLQSQAFISFSNLQDSLRSVLWNFLPLASPVCVQAQHTHPDHLPISRALAFSRGISYKMSQFQPKCDIHWGTFCQCSPNNVYTGLGGDYCPDCGPGSHCYCHKHGHNYGKAGGLSWEDNYSPPPAAIATETIQHLRASKKLLPIYLKNVLTEHAYADSGSELNCISKSYLRKIGAGFTLRRRDFKLPVKGLSIKSIGFSYITCRFPNGPPMKQTCTFQVFQSLVCDVILGRQFLRLTQTLDMHQHRLIEIESTPNASKVVRSIQSGCEWVYCWLEGSPVWCLPDTGSDSNLISLEFVRTIGYQ
jgi:hypothetical protein